MQKIQAVQIEPIVENLHIKELHTFTRVRWSGTIFPAFLQITIVEAGCTDRREIPLVNRPLVLQGKMRMPGEVHHTRIRGQAGREGGMAAV